MKQITFITGNPKKAEYLEKYLGFPVAHQRLDLDEIQSLDLYEVVEHKVRQAYEKIRKPVLVEDTACEFLAMGRLPGTFIKFFVEEMRSEDICNLLRSDRRAVARTTFGYYNGSELVFFNGALEGTIVDTPRGDNGFAFDTFFIPHWTDKTAAELNEAEYEKFYTTVKPFAKVREFLISKYY